MAFMLGAIYYVIGILMAFCWSCAAGFIICVFISLFRLFRHRRNIFLMLMYLAGAVVCSAIFFGLGRSTEKIAYKTDYVAYWLLFVGMALPGIWTLSIIPKYIRFALQQTSGARDIEAMDKPQRKQDRDPFDAFLIEQSISDTTISIEDVLEQYIKKYDLAVRHHLDEPQAATIARTKLQILEEASSARSLSYADPQFQNYLNGLRSLVQIYDTMSPEVRRLMKQREKTG